MMNFTPNFFISLVLSVLVISTTLLITHLLKSTIKKIKGKWYKAFKIGKHELLDTDNVEFLLKTIVHYFGWILILGEIYLSIPYVLKEEESTKAYANSIINNIVSGTQNIVHGMINYIPNLILILLIIFISHKLIQIIKFVFTKIEKKEIVVENFYSDWAETTKKLFTFLIIAFTFVIIYPYLPGSGSKALEGVSMFLGLLISLGSSSAISNIIAGVMLTYMRSFKIGDYIKAGNNIGKVIEKGLTVTRLCTYKNEIVVLPNTHILNSEIINYSDKANNKELILHTTITLGYDNPWTQIHSMLKEAAKNCELVNQEREPFVLQTSLNDFHISYELNAYTQHVELLPRVYDELHQNIQNVFSKNNVEIMSPSFTVYRSNPKDTAPNFNEITKFIK